jgi:branched-chain amino acid transport system permease protein
VTRLLNNNPNIANLGPPNLISALQWVAIGLLILGFLWFRPQGVRPEARRVFEGGPD